MSQNNAQLESGLLTGAKAFSLPEIKGEPQIDSSAKIADTAILRGNVKIGPNVEVKDFTIIEGDVTIGEGCIIEPNCVIRGPSVIGSNNHFYSFCSIGESCQDLKYKGEATTLHIGNDNTFREHCTVHRGTTQGINDTIIGNENLFMVNAHVAHDCVIGSHCIFANNATLAGHVTVGDYVIFGGLAAIHQFGRVGSHAFIAGMAALNKDVPPYVMAAGHYAKAIGINLVGLKRRGFSEQSRKAITKAFITFFKKGYSAEEALAKVEELAKTEPALECFVEFVKAEGRPVIGAKRNNRSDDDDSSED